MSVTIRDLRALEILDSRNRLPTAPQRLHDLLPGGSGL